MTPSERKVRQVVLTATILDSLDALWKAFTETAQINDGLNFALKSSLTDHGKNYLVARQTTEALLGTIEEIQSIYEERQASKEHPDV